MRDERHQQPPIIRDREGLLNLIANAIRIQIPYLNRQEARAAADTVLRSFKVAALSIKRRRQNKNDVRWTDRMRGDEGKL